MIYNENGFNYLVVGKETIEKLKTEIPAERMFVSKESQKKIEDLLKLETLTNEELIAVRNTVVKAFDENDDYDNWTRLSMITSVIDYAKYNKGMRV